MQREIIYLDKETFDNLPEYSFSLPTDKHIGKCWKRKVWEADSNAGFNRPEWHYKWCMGEYVKSRDPGKVAIKWYDIQLADLKEES